MSPHSTLCFWTGYPGQLPTTNYQQFDDLFVPIFLSLHFIMATLEMNGHQMNFTVVTVVVRDALDLVVLVGWMLGHTSLDPIFHSRQFLPTIPKVNRR